MARQQRDDWSIGELADAAGVTVRTLRHYDHIGLVVPQERSAGGHRRYSRVDVERLYRIVALRGLGFGLTDIAALLGGDGDALVDTFRRQLQAIDSEIEARRRLRTRLARMLDRIEDDRQLAAGELLNTLKELTMTTTIDRVYTGRGDDGETELGDGTKIAKTDPRLAVADLEELGAHLGIAASLGDLPRERARWLVEVQNDLLDICSELSRGDGVSSERLPRVTAEYAEWLEARCDEANRSLARLDSFTLPGDDPLAAQLHVCRTVCRRVERSVLAVDRVSPEITRYLNRLSDLLFILSRRDGSDESLWEPGRRARRRA